MKKPVNEKLAHKKEIIDRIAEKTGLKKKDIKPMLQALAMVVHEILEEDRDVLLNEICTVKTVEKAARKRYYTHAGKVVDEPAHKKIVIVPSIKLCKIIDQKNKTAQID